MIDRSQPHINLVFTPDGKMTVTPSLYAGQACREDSQRLLRHLDGTTVLSDHDTADMTLMPAQAAAPQAAHA